MSIGDWGALWLSGTVAIALTLVGVGLGRRIAGRRRVEDTLRSESERVATQQAALIGLTRETLLERRGVEAALRQLTETAAQALHVHRVSVWLCEADRSAAQSVDIYDVESGHHRPGDVLTCAQNPVLFEALHVNGPVTVDDLSDRRASRGSDWGANCSSVIVVPVYLYGDRLGMLSCEHVGPPRRWFRDEQMFAVALSNLVTLLYEQLDRKRVLEEMQRAHSLLNGIVEHIPAMIFVKDAKDLTFVRFNRAGEELLGYSRDMLLGKSDYDFFPRAEADFFTDKDREVLQSGRLLEIPEETIQTKHGERVLRTKKVPIVGEDGQPQYLLGISEDITDRKRTEQARVVLQYAIDHGMEGVALLDADGRFTYMNQAHAEIYGYDIAELIGRSWTVLHSPLQLADIQRAVLPLLERDGQWHGELVARKKTQEAVQVEVSLRRLDGGDDVPTMMLCTCRDIGDRKRAEAELIASRTFANNIVASSLDMIMVVDPERRLIEFNPAAQECFGYSAHDVLGRPVDLLFNEPRIGEDITAVTMQQGRHVREVVSRRKDGTLFHGLFSASVLRQADGWIVGVMGVLRDISEQKRALEELKKAKEAAESANQAKSEFLASMSHEIRTPMNAIIGMADLLWETTLSPEQQEYVGIFRRASISLLNLLNDILDLSKVEAGYLDLERIDFDLREIVDKTAEMMGLRASEKNLELACSVAPDVPVGLVGDPNRLRQVLLNLIGNAIKFTEAGEVTLRVEREPGSADPSVIRFTIRDTGIGIPRDKLGMIFERFTQADSSTTRRHGGTGLGLTISKRLVELMNGRMWVESEEGKGSTFSFTVCFQLQSRTDSAPAAELDLAGVRVLIADDNATNRLILREALGSWGALVHETADGSAALAALEAARHETPYRLVLLDCRMPGLSGFEVVQQFLARGTVPGTTFMVLTSGNRSDDIAHSYRLGLGGYLVKPIRRSDLRRAITIALNRPNGLGTAPAVVTVPPSQTDHPLHILLVEDSPDNRMLIQSYFKQANCTIDYAENGKMAVELFQAGRYDLVLMDMHMPIMDGYTATTMIRRWEQEHSRPPVPILALTAFGMKEEEQKSFAAGCTAHLTKPIRKATLLSAINEYGRKTI